MNKKEFIKEYNDFLKKFGLQPSDVIVGAGAACMVYGLRDVIKDIDVAVHPDLFKILNVRYKEKKVEVKESTGVRIARIISVGNIDVHILDSDIEFDIVDDIGVYTLNQLLKQKKTLNREKDQADIKAIEHLLNSKKGK